MRERGFRGFAFIGLVALAAACGGGADDDMEGMPGMSPPEAEEAVNTDAYAALRTHLGHVSTMPQDRLVVALPEHRQMVANMLAQMNREMSGMNMAADVAWNSTVDSIRSDLTAMPGMSPPDLATIMPAHRARVERLMSMHAAMMGRM